MTSLLERPLTWRALLQALLLNNVCILVVVLLMGTSQNGTDGAGSLFEESVASPTGSLRASSAEFEKSTPFVAAAMESPENPYGLINFMGGLGIPPGEATPLPSIQVKDGKLDQRRDIYGGKGDKQHLGGFTEYDGQGVSPAVWRYMIEEIGVKSVVDVGCGRGTSTLFFETHGVDVLGVDGSHDAIVNTIMPPSKVVEHDFSRGPYWPGKTYDAVWSVELLEHVGRNYFYNYFQIFRKSALIFATHSEWGGWHHVEVHNDEWWIRKYESFGLKYDAILTKTIRQQATEEYSKSRRGKKENPDYNDGPDEKGYNAQHIYSNMLVFVNPVVASLPEHAHLLNFGHGCYEKRMNDKIVNVECYSGVNKQNPSKKPKIDSPLPESYLPLQLAPHMYENWLTKVRAGIEQYNH